MDRNVRCSNVPAQMGFLFFHSRRLGARHELNGGSWNLSEAAVGHTDDCGDRYGLVA